MCDTKVVDFGTEVEYDHWMNFDGENVVLMIVSRLESMSCCS